MARVTIEDCLDNVENRFQLILTAAKRARQIGLGAEPLVPLENDKPTVLALREIASGNITRDILRQAPTNKSLIDKMVIDNSVSKQINTPDVNAHMQ